MDKCKVIKHNWVRTNSESTGSSLLLSVYRQCSRLFFVCPPHPATMTTYTTWTRQKAFATFSTSPSSTSDPWYYHRLVPPTSPSLFSPRFCWSSEGENRNRKVMSVSGHLCPQHTGSWRKAGENNTFTILTFREPREKKLMLKYYIFGLLCIINSCLCISFPACECVDIHCVCAQHLQEGKKNTLRKPFPIR